MISTVIYFDGEYYEYHEKKKEHGLAIGGYESNFLANLVAYYLLETSKTHFYHTIYYGINHDNRY